MNLIKYSLMLIAPLVLNGCMLSMAAMNNMHKSGRVVNIQEAITDDNRLMVDYVFAGETLFSTQTRCSMFYFARAEHPFGASDSSKEEIKAKVLNDLSGITNKKRSI